jgi:hypothetical protein
MAVKVKEKKFDCIRFKETLQAAMWEKSKAASLEEYVTWLKNETAKIARESASGSVPGGVQAIANQE